MNKTTPHVHISKRYLMLKILITSSRSRAKVLLNFEFVPRSELSDVDVLDPNKEDEEKNCLFLNVTILSLWYWVRK